MKTLLMCIAFALAFYAAQACVDDELTLSIEMQCPITNGCTDL